MKINGNEVIGEKFAYDSCHKIYILETKENEKEAIKYGYDIYDIDKIEETYNSSCPLRFIDNWNLDKQYVKQCENAIFN